MTKSHSSEQGGETRKAFAAVADALAEWRDEVATSTERYVETISEKIGEAGRAAGWPERAVEAARAHITQMSSFQLRLLDQFIEAWQQQLKSPVAADFLSSLRVAGAELQGHPGITDLASKPIEFWMQAALAWQRNMSSALSLWTGQAADRKSDRPRSH
jgi:hypothetical protein